LLLLFLLHRLCIIVQCYLLFDRWIDLSLVVCLMILKYVGGDTILHGSSMLQFFAVITFEAFANFFVGGKISCSCLNLYFMLIATLPCTNTTASLPPPLPPISTQPPPPQPGPTVNIPTQKVGVHPFRVLRYTMISIFGNFRAWIFVVLKLGLSLCVAYPLIFVFQTRRRFPHKTKNWDGPFVQS